VINTVPGAIAIQTVEDTQAGWVSPAIRSRGRPSSVRTRCRQCSKSVIISLPARSDRAESNGNRIDRSVTWPTAPRSSATTSPLLWVWD